MTGLRRRLHDGEQLIGTWIKTPSPIVVEVLAGTGLDVLCLDAEHAPFGRLELDACLGAAHARGMDTLVRLPTAAPHHLLQALDGGATGVVVPHVGDGDEAAIVARAARYGPEGRGFTASTRAGGHGAVPFAEHRVAADDATVVIAQIEDPGAVAAAAAIAGTDGIDAVFVGPVDLAGAIGADGPTADAVTEAVAAVVEAARSVGCPVGIHAATAEQRRTYAAMGVSLFLMQSDQVFLRAGAAALVDRSLRGDAD